MTGGLPASASSISLWTNEIELAPNASPLDFLCAVYRDPHQPMPRRMKAAEAALPFVHPKLSVSANFNSGLGSRMEAMMTARGISAVIDAKPNAKGS
jgi:hypothetical protein